METQNYDFFLFCELARCYGNEALKQEPYDVQFPVFFELFNEYLISNYNDADQSTYDCICNFLLNKENQKQKLIDKIQSIINEELPKIDYSDDMISNINRVIKQYKNQIVYGTNFKSAKR
jgi:hypothetical protein